MIRIQGLWRAMLVHSLSGVVPYYVINEYPKSGGTWLGQMVSDALGIPFPRHRMPLLRKSVMHGHHRSPLRMRNTVVLWRDGRDITVSWYYHCLFQSERTHPSFVAENRRLLAFDDYENVRDNLPRFIEYQFGHPRHPGFTWPEFVHNWRGRKGVVETSYEALRADTPGELKRVVDLLEPGACDYARAHQIAAKYSFERQSGRKTGQENIRSFLRKGVVGDWRNVFCRAARERFHHHAGGTLIELGYEKDASWID